MKTIILIFAVALLSSCKTTQTATLTAEEDYKYIERFIELTEEEGYTEQAAELIAKTEFKIIPVTAKYIALKEED